MKCPLSDQEITDPIVVYFENHTTKTYQASAFFAAFKDATTRKPEKFEHNVKEIKSETGAHQADIDAILELPYASLRQVKRFTSPPVSAQGLNFNGDSSSDSPRSAHSACSFNDK